MASGAPSDGDSVNNAEDMRDVDESPSDGAKGGGGPPWPIIGAVVGVVLLICVIGVCVVLARRNKGEKDEERAYSMEPTIAPATFDNNTTNTGIYGSATMLLQDGESAPAPTGEYGAAPQLATTEELGAGRMTSEYGAAPPMIDDANPRLSQYSAAPPELGSNIYDHVEDPLGDGEGLYDAVEPLDE